MPEHETREAAMSVRRRILRSVILTVAAAMLATACASQNDTDHSHTKQYVGLGLGAALGAVAGSFLGDGAGRLAAMTVGAVIGGTVGADIGNSLDRADAAYLHQATRHALEDTPDGEAVAWRNPHSGTHGQVKPGPARLNDGRYCRNFTSRVWIDARTMQAGGLACRSADGHWQIVDNDR